MKTIHTWISSFWKAGSNFATSKMKAIHRWARPHIPRFALYCAICAALYLVMAGVIIYTHKDGLPSFEKLEDVDPAQTTHIFSQDGVELKKFWVQRRDPHRV